MKWTLLGRREANGWAALFAMVAVVSLGQALQAGDGFIHPLSFIYLGVTLATLVLGVAFSRLPDPEQWVDRGILTIGLLAVGYQLFLLADEQPADKLEGRKIEYLGLLVLMTAFTVPVVLQWPKFRQLYVIGWLAAFSALGVWIVRETPEPFIDVYWWTHHALDVLSRGENPFAAWMPNIYGHACVYPDGTNGYGRPLSEDEKWVMSGYPYPPFSLILSGGGYLFGDMRWASLAFLVISAIAILKSGGRYAALGAALLLTTPRIFYVLEHAWTDVYCLGLLALTASLSARSSRLTPWMFGLLIASKHYMIFLVPLGFLLIPTPWDRRKLATFILQAVVAGLVVTLPWFLWDPQAMRQALIGGSMSLHNKSLSYLVLLSEEGEPPYAGALCFYTLVVSLLLILVCSARGAGGFAMSSALILGLFFSFARHAFCNQHFLILGCAAVALGTIRFEPRTAPPSA